MRQQRLQRERWADLVSDSGPVVSGAFDMVSRELESLSDDVTVEDAVQLGRTVARAVPTMEALLRQLESVSALGEEIVPLATPAMASLTSALRGLEDKGYFAFAKGGADIVDKVVTSFTEDDIDALGDNVVLILNTVKEMTQPEVMTLLQRTALTAQDVDGEFAEAPSTFALLKQMRDPQTRRGLGRVMTMLRTIGAEQPAPKTDTEG
ncbi:MAG: DUF1641 domain-containing protein [Actinomycetia bacterium]|nr:DUF1641 domain-containing protein [Actinomycetes bacterium]